VAGSATRGSVSGTSPAKDTSKKKPSSSSADDEKKSPLLEALKKYNRD
jgi:hypothetical protein